LVRLEVEAVHVGQQDLDVRVPPEDGPQRPRDLTGSQSPGRDLIGEGLEQVEVPPVDDCDVDVVVAESERRP
jgi:hypothetical protein